MSALRLAAAGMAIACATAADAQQADAPVFAAGWTPLLVLFGVLALIGALLLMTRPGLRRAPWESDETEASTARGREKRLAKELRTLWDKTTTAETLRPQEEPKP